MNTQENKAKFFAQYWGQKVIRSEGGHRLHVHVCSHVNLEHESWYLELKPLSSISDEDAIKCIKHCEGNIDKDITGMERQYVIDWLQYRADGIDYLRSKGFALDWNGITVEQQIEWGWIKLIEA